MSPPPKKASFVVQQSPIRGKLRKRNAALDDARKHAQEVFAERGSETFEARAAAHTVLLAKLGSLEARRERIIEVASRTGLAIRKHKHRLPGEINEELAQLEEKIDKLRESTEKLRKQLAAELRARE